MDSILKGKEKKWFKRRNLVPKWLQTKKKPRMASIMPREKLPGTKKIILATEDTEDTELKKSSLCELCALCGNK